MPQIPFAFEFEYELRNELPLGCSENVALFLLKMVKWQFGQTFQNKNSYIFECEWPMVIQRTCAQLNCLMAIHTKTQTQTETGGYRMHSFFIY